MVTVKSLTLDSLREVLFGDRKLYTKLLDAMEDCNSNDPAKNEAYFDWVNALTECFPECL